MMSPPHAFPIPPWVGMSVILLAFGAVMAAMIIVKRRWPVHPEVPRKCAHVVMGLVSLPLPWLFESVRPVVAIACLTLASLLLLRLAARRNYEVGYILHWSAQRRRSVGDLLFPVSITTVFWLSGGQPLLFCLPLLYLTVSDTVACVVGMRFASTTERKRKSIEGSLAFLLTTFGVTAAGLLGFTNDGALTALLMATGTAAALCVVEAISFRGLDNFTVPIVGYLTLAGASLLDTPPLVALVSLSVVTSVMVLFWEFWTAYAVGPIATVERFMAFVFTAPGGGDRPVD